MKQPKLVIGLNNKNKKTFGFTLLEVMIALVVIALTLAAFIKVSTLQAKHLIYLQNKTFALWVAEDVTHELQAGKKAWSSQLKELYGESSVFQKKFEWHIQFEPTEDPRVFRSEMTVNLKGEHTVLSRYVSYFSEVPKHENNST